MQLGIAPQIAALETLLYPSSGQLIANDALQAVGTLEIAPLEDAADAVRLEQPARRARCGSRTSASPRRRSTRTSTRLRAKVSLSLRVLSVDDLGFDHKGGALYLIYQQNEGAARPARARRRAAVARPDGDPMTTDKFSPDQPLSADVRSPRSRWPTAARSPTSVAGSCRRRSPSPSCASTSCATATGSTTSPRSTSATRSSSGGSPTPTAPSRRSELTDEVGRRLRITLPAGVPGTDESSPADDRHHEGRPHAARRTDGRRCPRRASSWTRSQSVEVTSGDGRAGPASSSTFTHLERLAAPHPPAGRGERVAARPAGDPRRDRQRHPDVLADGVITRQEITPGRRPGTSTLTITGEDLTTVMDRQEFNGLPYPAMPAEARVALIVAKYAMYGIVPLVDPVVLPGHPDPGPADPVARGHGPRRTSTGSPPTSATSSTSTRVRCPG